MGNSISIDTSQVALNFNPFVHHQRLQGTCSAPPAQLQVAPGGMELLMPSSCQRCIVRHSFASASHHVRLRRLRLLEAWQAAVRYGGQATAAFIGGRSARISVEDRRPNPKLPGDQPVVAMYYMSPLALIKHHH